jgi:dGTPase
MEGSITTRRACARLTGSRCATPNFRGLNLSFEVREGIIKHSSFKGRAAAQEFDTDQYPCLEAQIVDLADEIAYLAHDVDDGLKAQMLTVAELNGSRLYREAAAMARAITPAAGDRLMRYQTVIRMIDVMVTDLVANIDREIEVRGYRQRRGGAAGGQGDRRSFSAEVTAQVKELKQIMRDRLLSSLPGEPDDREGRGGCSRACSRPTWPSRGRFPEHVLLPG